MSKFENVKYAPVAGGLQSRTGFKIFLTIWAFLENALFAGLRAGWPALVFIFKEKGIYEFLCEETSATNENKGLSLTLEDEANQISATGGVKIFLTNGTAYSSGGIQSPLSRPTANGNVLRILLQNGTELLNQSATSFVQEIIAPSNDETAGGALKQVSSYFETTTTLAYGNASETILNRTRLNCDGQDAVFNQCFTIASATMSLSALMYGHLNYKFGIRVPRILSVFLFVLGCLCIAFIDRDMPWLMYPGLLLVSSGGMALYLTNNQISYMFTTGSAAVIGLLCGALEASSFTQSIVKIAFENGVTLKTSYLTIAGLYTMTLVSTFFFLPKGFITNETLRDLDIEKEDEPREVTMITGQGQLSQSGNTQNNSVLGTSSNLDTDNSYTSDLQNGAIIHNEPQTISDGAYFEKVDLEKATDSKSQKGSKPATNQNILDVNNLVHSLENVLYMEIPVEKLEQQMTLSATANGAYKDRTLIKDEQFINRNDNQPTEKQDIIDETQKSQSGEQSSLPTTDNLSRKVLITNTPASIISQSERAAVSTNHSEPRTEASQPGITLWRCILSKNFMLYLFWASVVQIILTICLGTFNPWVTYVTNENETKVSQYTDALLYSMLGAPVLALLMGTGLDLLKRTKADPNSVEAKAKTIFAATVSLSLTSVLGVLVCVCVMTLTDGIVIVACICLVLFRTGLYSCGTAFLRIMYPTEYFGVLCGIMTVLAGGFAMLQYPLFLWIQHRNNAWREVFGFVGCLGIISLAQPAYMIWKRRQLLKPKE